MKRKIIASLIFLNALSAQADNWSLGAGSLIAANPYLSMNTNILLIPFISYQSKYLAVYGPMAKLRYSLNPNNILGLRLQIGMQEFSPEEASNLSMKNLDERKRLFYVGPYHRFKSDYGQLTTSFGYDVSNRSNGGMLLDLQYAYPFKSQNRKFFIRPGIGFSWFNQALSRHYYQISSSESNRSGLKQYNANSFIQPFASLFAGINISKKIFWTNVVRLNYLPSTVRNSPMVSNKRITYSLITGITYEIGEEKQRFNH